MEYAVHCVCKDLIVFFKIIPPFLYTTCSVVAVIMYSTSTQSCPGVRKNAKASNHSTMPLSSSTSTSSSSSSSSISSNSIVPPLYTILTTPRVLLHSNIRSEF